MRQARHLKKGVLRLTLYCICTHSWYNVQHARCGCTEEIMDFTEIDNTLYCSFSKRLDGQACSLIEGELVRRIADFREHNKDGRCVFDLNKVTFVSSAFLRLCLMQFKTFGKNLFSITNVSKEMYTTFHVSGFAEMMHVARCRCPSQETTVLMQSRDYG